MFQIVYLIVAATKGDVNRLIHGYDDFGNICGQKNEKHFDNVDESGQNHEKKP